MQQPITSQNIDLAKDINNIIGQLKAVLNKAAPMASVAGSIWLILVNQCSYNIKVKPLVAKCKKS